MSKATRRKCVMISLGIIGTLLHLVLYSTRGSSSITIQSKDINFGWDVYRKRIENVNTKCKLLPADVPQYTIEKVYKDFIYAIPHKLVYCPINKVATTTWFDNFLVLAGLDPSTVDHKRKMVRGKLWKFPKSIFNYKKQLKESLKFFIVRHPFERLLSCYRDKMLMEDYRGKFPYLQQKAALKYSDPIQPSPVSNRTTIFKNDPANQNNSQALWIHPTFTQFLYFVRDDMKQLWQSGGGYTVNRHWEPYWVTCAPCQVEYDVLAHLGTINEDNNFIMQEAGIKHLLNTTHLHKPKYDNFSSSAEAQQHYFSQVPRSLLQELEKLYHPDMVLFGYSPQPYLDMALHKF